MRENYSLKLSKLLAKIAASGEVPHLLLHACCAPCSSYVLEYLSEFFKITVLYYNPNIAPEAEYRHRVSELKRFVREFKTKNPVEVIEGRYEPGEFYEAVKGLEAEPEGGERCKVCFRLRLSEAAKCAKEVGADYFTTSLTISPMKDAELLNKIGEEEAAKAGVRHLPSNFKKKGGYARSVELSAEYGLYRQDFCGCVFSMREAEERKQKRAKCECLSS